MANSNWITVTHDFGSVGVEADASVALALDGVNPGMSWFSSNIEDCIVGTFNYRIWASDVDEVTITLTNLSQIGPVATGEITFIVIAHNEEL